MDIDGHSQKYRYRIGHSWKYQFRLGEPLREKKLVKVGRIWMSISTRTFWVKNPISKADFKFFPAFMIKY